MPDPSQDPLDQIKGPGEEPEKTPDPLSKGAFQKADADEKKTKEKRQELKNQQLAQNIAERKKYANRLFWFIVIWLAIILLIVILRGSSILDFSDNVLMTLIGSTTLNVLGLFFIVANYLFSNASTDKE